MNHTTAMRVIKGLERPALILSAADDPFVPADIFRTQVVREHPHITTLITNAGGHCAFVAPPNGDDGYFAERTVIGFLAARLPR